MAVLPEADRADVWAELMRKYSTDGETIGIPKADLRAAVDAIDNYMNDNAAAINQSLPEPARTTLTASQKAILLSYVVFKRYQVEV
ncbi:MAG: hypothetical protein GWN55_04280 [Phycisphaerae bacterium]|nr:hypothetical protein [Gammaproteobacteria bacterium]NIR25573.1 hypothetical protein [Gammaproteobacteria bacterium]NIS54672.1 hypothetical protein [Phycisphaerae bacterium]NIV00537.1 hypothetical protein [Phycisphaerae bacterium]NIW97877.1 hypothetical protein [Phycisphaerae bacterium]